MGEVKEGGVRERGDILPEGIETGLCAEVFCLFPRGEHAVYAFTHGVVWKPGIGKCLAEFFDFWGESGDVW